MHEYGIDPADEGRPEPSGERFWNGSNDFDFHRDGRQRFGWIEWNQPQ